MTRPLFRAVVSLELPRPRTPSGCSNSWLEACGGNWLDCRHVHAAKTASRGGGHAIAPHAPRRASAAVRAHRLLAANSPLNPPPGACRNDSTGDYNPMTYQNFSLKQLQDIDAAHHLHPFTDHKDLRAAGSRMIVGAEGPERHALDRVASGRPRPGVVTLVAASDHGDQVPLLSHRGEVGGSPAAYVCRDLTCDRPVTAPADLADDELPGDPGDPEHSYVGMMVRNVRIMVEALGGDPSALDAVEPSGQVPDGGVSGVSAASCSSEPPASSRLPGPRLGPRLRVPRCRGRSRRPDSAAAAAGYPPAMDQGRRQRDRPRRSGVRGVFVRNDRVPVCRRLRLVALRGDVRGVLRRAPGRGPLDLSAAPRLARSTRSPLFPGTVQRPEAAARTRGRSA